MKDYTAINIKLEQSLYDRMVQSCNKHDRSKTAIVERALRAYFDLEDLEENIARTTPAQRKLNAEVRNAKEKIWRTKP